MNKTILLLWLISLLGTETTCRTIRNNLKELLVPKPHPSNDANEEVRINRENKEDNSFHIGRIINGKNASILDYPWQVIVKQQNYFFCAGVIINADTILTAAHCFEDDPRLRNGRYYITAGDDDPKNYNNGEQTRRIKSAKLYKDYIGQSNAWDGDVAVLKVWEQLEFTARIQPIKLARQRNAWDGDVAVLKLREPLEFTSRIQPIKLANKKKERRALKKGNCVVTGFGYIQQDPNRVADSLQEVAITMKDRNFCSAEVALYGNTLTQRMMCSYDSNKGACRGDSGGPVMCRYKRKMILVGLVSWSNRDCFVGFNVYARISTLASWINRNI